MLSVCLHAIGFHWQQLTHSHELTVIVESSSLQTCNFLSTVTITEMDLRARPKWTMQHPPLQEVILHAYIKEIHDEMATPYMYGSNSHCRALDPGVYLHQSTRHTSAPGEPLGHGSGSPTPTQSEVVPTQNFGAFREEVLYTCIH